MLNFNINWTSTIFTILNLQILLELIIEIFIINAIKKHLNKDINLIKMMRKFLNKRLKNSSTEAY